MTEQKQIQSKLSYEDLCAFTLILRKLDEEDAIMLICIFEQLLRGAK